MSRPLLALALVLLTACGGPSVRLRRLVLYQNGIGYFERSGEATSDRVALRLRRHEVDDVMKTLTVIGANAATGLTAVVPEPAPEPLGEPGQDGEPAPARDPDDETTLELDLGGARGPLTITYAVPTPTWGAVYRVVLPDEGEQALLQAWAVVHNASGEDWEDVELTLATGAPFTYAIDLRTPRFIARPDLTGAMVEPVISGAVMGTRARGDGDGVEEGDLCPTEPEDRDGFEDEDGCPDPDNDRDRIPDVDDMCPNDPETYNGVEDEDGCPDRGSVVISESSITILDQIYFASRSSAVNARQAPILDAVAATLLGNPDVTRVTIEGHTARNEPNALALSRARAQTVLDELVRRGVLASRFTVAAMGAEQPVDPRNVADAHERNRRVRFRIDETSDGPVANAPAPPPPARHERASTSGSAEMPARVTVDTAQGSVRTVAVADDTASETRYRIATPVTIPRGSTTMVAIVNQRVRGAEVLLYRPDASAPLSRSHPFRAARLVNESGLSLVPGPVALLAGGTYVGEGVLDGLSADESTFLPYAIDRSTEVIAHPESDGRPNRLVSLARGVMVVEDWAVRRTRYEVRAGARAPSRIWIHHAGAFGFDYVELPGETVQSGTSVIVPVSVTAGERAELVIEERRATERRIAILDTGEALGAYVEGEHLPAELRARLRGILEQRAALDAIDGELREVRDQAAVQSRRLAELQSSLRAIERSSTAADLRRQLQQRLEEASAASERLITQEAALTARRAEARVRLSEALIDLRYEPEATE
ncbi:MAG: OmpA family protein [Sandaracinaceae bacterium]